MSEKIVNLYKDIYIIFCNLYLGFYIFLVEKFIAKYLLNFDLFVNISTLIIKHVMFAKQIYFFHDLNICNVNIEIVYSYCSSSHIFVFSILNICSNLHDRIMSLRRKVWVDKTSLTPPLFIEVPVPSQESDSSCICVLPISTSLILELFRQCGIEFWLSLCKIVQ